jgi:pimeloyl-ACP methyl ester carboxylesterase
MRAMTESKRIEAGVLDVAYEEAGDRRGKPVILLHGFPYDVRAFDDVAVQLVSSGCRVITPYLRGYGPTRFLSEDTPRSGQQAALAQDLLELMDALEISSAIEPSSPENEQRYWYQWYFHGERGRRGLDQNRHALCRLLWRLWSPNWDFDEATYERTAESFGNPDFVDVVIHSYRHRYGLVAGDPEVEAIEEQLTTEPCIRVPTVAMDGDGDGVMSIGGCAGHERHFEAAYDRVVIPLVGHNLPQEAPVAFTEAVLTVMQAS